MQSKHMYSVNLDPGTVYATLTYTSTESTEQGHGTQHAVLLQL